MGAQLSLLAQTTPSIGISSYIDILEQVHYISQLNSSKFLKTCKALDPNGEIIIKIFIKPDEAYSQFDTILGKIKEESGILSQLPTVLNYSKIIDSNRAVYLIRQHLKANLYDRINSRPYLHKIELKFIVFQILQSLVEIHDLNIIHGDIKCENILITSNNWIVLSDFSSHYKPVYLPEDNPGEFSFYFDTSKRRCCYVAPERFDSKLYNDYVNDNEKNSKKYKITKQMDIFSAGCCIFELFNEGVPLFNLSQLFKYKNNELDIKSLLREKLVTLNDDQDAIYLCDLISDMIQRNPQKRLSAVELLNKYRNKLFPNYFYNFIYEYFKTLTILTTNFASNNNINVNNTLYDSMNVLDTCVEKIYNDFDKICNSLTYPIIKRTNGDVNNNNNLFFDNFIEISPDSKILLKKFEFYQNNAIINDECALLFISYLSHCLRCCQSNQNKIKCIELLTAFSQFISDENKIDRVIPYLMTCFDSNCDNSNVRALALQCLCQLLGVVETVNQLNDSIFIDYIFPRLKRLLQQSKNDSYVRIIFANCLSKFVITANKFQELSLSRSDISILAPTTNNSKQLLQTFSNFQIANHDTKILFNFVHDLTINLLTDNDIWVKIALLKNILPLCKFFGREKTNDVILSHLITYLNDRNYFLRMTLVETIPSIAILLGPITLEQYILPLLIQTLTDSEENVVIAVLLGLKDLCKTGLINKKMFYDIAATIAPLVLHPNFSIHQTSIMIIYEISKNLSNAEIYCKLYPIIRPFFGFDVEFTLELLIESCRRPVSRTVYNLLHSWSLRASNSLFWQQVPTDRMDSFGNNNITFITKDYIPSNYRTKNDNVSKTKLNLLKKSKNVFYSFDKKEIPLTTEDKLWVDKFKTIGVPERDLWKLEILRSYIIRTSKSWNSKSHLFARNDSIQNEYETSVVLSNIMPRNVFFDIQLCSSRDEISRNTHNQSSNNSLELFSENDKSSKHALPPVVNIHGSLIFNAKPLATTTPDLRNVYVQLDTNGTVTKPISNQVQLDMLGKRKYIVKNSYDGDVETIENFLSNIEMRPSLKEYREFGFQTKINPIIDNINNQKGRYVASLTENIRVSITSLVASSDDNPYLLSSSLEGIIYLWDIQQIIAGNLLSSSLAFNCDSSILHMELLPGYDTVVCCTKNGKLILLRIIYRDSHNMKIFENFECIRKLTINNDNDNDHESKGESEERYIIRFKPLLNDDMPIIVAITNLSEILLIDVRDMSILNTLENPVSHGAIYSFEVNSDDSTLIVGTVNGIIDIWDLRFEEIIHSFTFGESYPISKILLAPALGKSHIIIIGGSKDTLFTIWDYTKIQCKNAVLLADEFPSPSKYKPVTNNLESIKFTRNSGGCPNVSTLAINGSSILLTFSNTNDIVTFNMSDYQQSRIIRGPNMKEYSFVCTEVTTNLSIILMKYKHNSGKSITLANSKDILNNLVAGQFGSKSVLFASNSKGIIDTYL